MTTIPTITNPNRGVPVAAIDDLLRRVAEVQRGHREGGALPPHAEQTIAQARALQKPATRRQVLDALSILAGLFGPRGDAEVVAAVGAALVEAERPSVAELHIALLALIRPAPGEKPSLENDFEGVPPKPRVFAPTISEVLAAILEARSEWRWRMRSLENALGRHDADRMGGGGAAGRETGVGATAARGGR